MLDGWTEALAAGVTKTPGLTPGILMVADAFGVERPAVRHDADGCVIDVVSPDDAPDATDALRMFGKHGTRAKWHRERANGQRRRFDNLAACGTRNVIATCGVCDKSRKGVPDGCGIVRLCQRCSLFGAKERRARFGRARARVICDADEIGYTRKNSSGWAKWLDRMVTLTAPHFLACNIEDGTPLAKKMRELGIALTFGTTVARVWALRLAWPLFLRRLTKHWKGNPVRDTDKVRERLAIEGRDIVMRGKQICSTPETIAMLPRYEEDSEGHKRIVEGTPPYHRAFEWTPGNDGLGHPHFHVWSFCPWIDAAIVRGFWLEALRTVGVPIENDYVRVQVQVFQDVNVHAARELMKGGREGAIKLSRMKKRGAPKNAFQYADGWTIGEVLEAARPDVIASLYCALEGMRLAQASRAFFGLDDPPECLFCGHHYFRVHFEPREHQKPVRVLDAPVSTGPP